MAIQPREQKELPSQMPFSQKSHDELGHVWNGANGNFPLSFDNRQASLSLPLSVGNCPFILRQWATCCKGINCHSSCYGRTSQANACPGGQTGRAC